MPRLRRKPHTIRGGLTNQQWSELVLGPLHNSTFANEDERREAWRIHGESIFAELRDEWQRPSCVPWAQTEYGDPGVSRRVKGDR
jgi:hypothetical protein